MNHHRFGADPKSQATHSLPSVELHESKSDIVTVAGTAGKTTTTQLLDHVLRTHGYQTRRFDSLAYGGSSHVLVSAPVKRFVKTVLYSPVIFDVLKCLDDGLRTVIGDTMPEGKILFILPNETTIKNVSTEVI